MSERASPRAPSPRAGERGFALASVMLIMFIILLLTTVAVSYAVSSLGETNRSRDSAQAFELADSATDVINWHMNRHLVSNDVRSLVGLTSGVVATAGCLNLSGNQLTLGVLDGQPASGFCDAVAIPNLAAGQSVTCYTSTNVGLDLSNTANLTNNLLTRQIVCQGSDNGVERRILARMALRVNSARPTTLWRRDAWVECTSGFASETNPAAGCPSLPTIGS